MENKIVFSYLCLQSEAAEVNGGHLLKRGPAKHGNCGKLRKERGEATYIYAV